MGCWRWVQFGRLRVYIFFRMGFEQGFFFWGSVIFYSFIVGKGVQSLGFIDDGLVVSFCKYKENIISLFLCYVCFEEELKKKDLVSYKMFVFK